MEEPTPTESEKQVSTREFKKPGISIGEKIKQGLLFFKRYFHECKRVLKVTKKPDKESFITIVKVSGAGMAVIGVIGFIIHILQQLLF